MKDLQLSSDDLVSKAVSRDPFDLNALRMDQSSISLVGVEKQIVSVPVRKPDPQVFFRVHPSEDYHLTTAVLHFKEDNEYYLVLPSIRDSLPDSCLIVTLFLTINRSGDIYLFPIRMPDADGRQHDAHKSAFVAATLAMNAWVRMTWKRSIGAYDILKATGTLTEPAWPTTSFQEIVRIAFMGKVIDRFDHPILQRLRGEK